MHSVTSQHKELPVTFCDKTHQSPEDYMQKLYHNVQLYSKTTVLLSALLHVKLVHPNLQLYS